MTNTPQNFYRRHRRDCPAGHREDSFSGEYEERKKGWKRCSCPISVSGKQNGKFRRKSLGVSDWDQAREMVANWKSEAPEPPPPTTPAVPEQRATIQDVAGKFLKHHSNSAAGTLRMYGYFMDHFKDFSLSLGYVYLDQWRTTDVRSFRDSWPRSVESSNTKLGQFKTFFKFCVENEWITESPAAKVANLGTKRQAQTAKNKERVPFSDQELEWMFDACQRLYNPKKDHRFRFTGQDLADFIAISVYTGLRISDVATFHASQMAEDGSIAIRMIKTDKPVYTWVPVWLQQRIQERAKTFGPFIFGRINTADLNIVTQLWRDRLNRLWDLRKSWEVKPVPHRFRHTFARILLQKSNITVRDVAELLGNTEDVVRRHYAAWIPERQQRLTKLLQEAFADKPQPDNVIEFPAVG